MNESDLNLCINSEEHEALISALNSYYDTVCDILPAWAEDVLSESYEISKFRALKKVREKLLNSWSDRFNG
jgi:hypothetical protein